MKITKPTDDAECLSHVERACIIEDAINDKVGTRNLEDGEIVNTTNNSEDSNADNEFSGDDSDGSSSDNLLLPLPPKKCQLVKQPVIPTSH